MPASGFCVLVPASVSTYRAGTVANLNIFGNCHFLRNDVSNHFTYILSLVLCPVPCLHFYCSFCLETEKCPWRPKSVPLGQKRF
ncbi:unnamed protein product [Staurois parvus]|uniref:Secreted protein n=1 Tax=Staurois parvus TaxID=386267 RepID=A0ABN9DXZ0_9NEOB|nr:unnamed protein product [Staurois parvus]